MVDFFCILTLYILLIDEDVNGSIDLEELKQCLQKLTLTLKEEEVEDLFHSCDIDNSMSSMFIETSKMGSPELQATFDTIIEAFLFLDKNVPVVLKSLNHPLGDSCEYMQKKWTGTGMGRIDADEEIPEKGSQTRHKNLSWITVEYEVVLQVLCMESQRRGGYGKKL
ncbi:hypothetical protein Peur_026244 [Populus x canadensis]